MSDIGRVVYVYRKQNKNIFIPNFLISDWPEIKESLFSGESSHDRPDIVTRVFEMKAQELMKDIEEGGCLGRVISIMAIVEWQKRGKVFFLNSTNHLSREW